MNSIKKETKIKMKVTKVFKFIVTFLFIVTFTVSAISCKEASVVEEQQQEEEKGQEIVPSETAETEKGTIQEETPPVVEEVPEKIEWEGITFSPVEGLRFDKGDFYFMDGNPYGGEVGEKAGVLILKDAVKAVVDWLEAEGYSKPEGEGAESSAGKGTVPKGKLLSALRDAVKLATDININNVRWRILVGTPNIYSLVFVTVQAALKAVIIKSAVSRMGAVVLRVVLVLMAV